MILESPLSQEYKIIEQLIQDEIRNNKILSDVETFLSSSYTGDHIETPLIWMEKQQITPVSSRNFGRYIQVEINCSFVCCADANDDFSITEKASMSLACRVLTCILCNVKKHLTNQSSGEYNRNIVDITVNNIDPTGTFEITNKRVIIPATRIELTFTANLDMMKYILVQDGNEEVVIYDEDTSIESISFENITTE